MYSFIRSIQCIQIDCVIFGFEQTWRFTASHPALSRLRIQNICFDAFSLSLWLINNGKTYHSCQWIRHTTLPWRMRIQPHSVISMRLTSISGRIKTTCSRHLHTHRGPRMRGKLPASEPDIYHRIFFSGLDWFFRVLQKVRLNVTILLVLAASGLWLCLAVRFPFFQSLNCYYCAGQTSVPRHWLKGWDVG